VSPLIIVVAAVSTHFEEFANKFRPIHPPSLLWLRKGAFQGKIKGYFP